MARLLIMHPPEKNSMGEVNTHTGKSMRTPREKAAIYQPRRRPGTALPSQPPEETNSADTSLSDVEPLEL